MGPFAHQGPAVQAVDQQARCAAIQINRPELRFLQPILGQPLGPHDPWQAAAGQGRRQPAALDQQQQVGGGGTAELAGGVEQQGFVGAPLLGFAAGLHRPAVGKGLAGADLAGGIAPFALADDAADRLKTRPPGAQLQPEAMVMRPVLRRQGDAAAGVAPAPVEAQGGVATAAALDRLRQ